MKLLIPEFPRLLSVDFDLGSPGRGERENQGSGKPLGIARKRRLKMLCVRESGGSPGTAKIVVSWQPKYLLK